MTHLSDVTHHTMSTWSVDHQPWTHKTSDLRSVWLFAYLPIAHLTATHFAQLDRRIIAHDLSLKVSTKRETLSCKNNTTHGLDGQHQDVDRNPRGRDSQNDRRQMDKVRPWCGQPSDRGRLKNITDTYLNLNQSIFIYIRQPEPIVARPIHIKRNKRKAHTTQ